MKSLPNPNDIALLVTAEKLAELLCVSVRTIWRLDSAGKLPAPLRFGGNVRWQQSDITAWLLAGCPSRR
jgi:excisionase family DNA binding protein